jgi:hypothetical protein
MGFNPPALPRFHQAEALSGVFSGGTVLPKMQ